MRTWNATIRREIRRFERKLIAACESFAVHRCTRRRAEECDSAAKTLRLVFNALQVELHEFVGITPPDELDADKVESATFWMDDVLRTFRQTVVGAWTIRRLDTGLTDADRNVVFDAMEGARRGLCKLAVKRSARRGDPREARIRGLLADLYRRAYHTPDCLTTDPIPEAEFADTIEGDIDNALAAVMEEVGDA